MTVKSSDAIQETLARLQGAAEHGVTVGSLSPSAEDDRWIVAATARDGWRVDVCDQVLRGKGIATQLESAGGKMLLVKRSDYSAAVAALESDKRRLWSKPGKLDGTIVTVTFLFVVSAVIIGMAVTIGGQEWGPFVIAITVAGVAFLGLLSLARLASR